ncbi:response regulator [Pontivivens ytuae]|uniref:response regulator n=1 Tax=Pontivivens ytuae TaxID=2789856 RepID=UPI001E5C4255|nr:response regulator [Pontivivens ytuae]
MPTIQCAPSETGGRATPAPAPPEQPDSPLAGRTILIAEDEALMALDLEITLAEAGALILGPVAQVGEGLSLAKAQDNLPSAALLDVNLCGEEVYPLAEWLAERGVPLVFHTGHASPAAIAARFDAAAIFAKPADMQALLAALVDATD